MSKIPYPLDTFEHFLGDVAYREGAFDGVVDDDYPDAFDSWLMRQDVNSMLEYGTEYGKHLARFVTEEHA